MESNYYFFFSYARNNHSNAEQQYLGKTWNYLDEFYNSLCQQVSDIAAIAKEKVAFRDNKRLKIGNIIDNELINGLQKARVFLALISPDYLQSDYCEFELSFFHKRIQTFAEQSNDGQEPPYILPLFWEDSNNCFKDVPLSVKNFFKRFNFTQDEMPDKYPVVGLSQICRLDDYQSFQRICRSIAQRIVDLAISPQILPELAEIADFNQIERLYTKLKGQDEQNIICEGSAGANVVYFVGNKNEMETLEEYPIDAQLEEIPLDAYQEQCEAWIPFPEAPDESIEHLTDEGARTAGIDKLNNIGLPENLMALLDTAKDKNSPVLIVFDRSSLLLTKFRTKISEYAERIYPNCGLVTAGGRNIHEDQFQTCFNYVFLRNFPNHFWSVPAGKEEYMSSVAQALQGIKKQLMAKGETTYSGTAPKVMPGLRGPGRN